MSTEYFSGFPTTISGGRDLVNITIRLNLLNKVKTNVVLFQTIEINDRQRPEDIARDYYGDTNLYWIVLFINDIIDPYYDWVLSDNRFFEFVKKKYGDSNAYAIHHYEASKNHPSLDKGTWVNSTEPFSEPVSNYTYEQEINEAKRKIKVLKPQYIAQFIEEYNKILRTNI